MEAGSSMAHYITTRLCQAGDIGTHGNLFGGTMLAWLDEAGVSLAAYLCASPNLVTLKMKDVLFKQPVKAGDYVRFFGEVLHVGNSSITLGVEAKRYLFDRQELELVCATEMTYVRIDDQGKPIPIDPQVKEQIE